MQRIRRKSLLSRVLGGRTPARGVDVQPAEPGRAAIIQDDPSGKRRLEGASLEQAYRELLLENQVLAESNARLHERLAMREDGLEDTPATLELVRAQRNALAERSHRLRELEYENKRLQRDLRKLGDEQHRTAALVVQLRGEIEPARQRLAACQRELEAARDSLREKSRELASLTDRYYQLEARTGPHRTVVNGEF